MKNQKGIILPVVIIIVLAVVVAGGYLVYKQNSALKKSGTATEISGTGTPTGTPTPSATPTETPTDQTAGWKTYTNTQYGYQIKYPADWDYYLSNNKLTIYCDYFKRDNEPCKGLESVGIGDVGPSVSIDIKQISLEDFKKDWIVKKQENYLLDGVQGQKIFGWPIIGIGWDYNVIFAIKNNNNYFITYPNFGYLPIQSQILSTFKFTK